MSRQWIKPGHPRWEESTLEKRHSNSLLIAIRNINIGASNQWENACEMAPPSSCVTWTYMNTLELHKDVGWIAVARYQQSICQLPKHHALANPHIHCQAGQNTSWLPLWRDLTKVISILNYCRGPRTDMPWPGIKHGLHSERRALYRKETFEQLVKSYSEHLLMWPLENAHNEDNFWVNR